VRERDGFAERVRLAEQSALLWSATGATAVAKCPDCGEPIDIAPRHTTHAVPACAAWAAYTENWEPGPDFPGKPFDLHVPAIKLPR